MTINLPNSPPMPTQSIAEQAQTVVKLFNSIVGSHRRLTQTALESLEHGDAVNIISGTAERPVIEITLQREGTQIIATVRSDQTLPPRMRAQAQAMVERFLLENRKTWNAESQISIPK